VKTLWDLPESPEKLYYVPEKRWAKWPNAARVLFNETMNATYDPDAVCRGIAVESFDKWRTIRYHITLMAANKLARMLKVRRGDGHDQHQHVSSDCPEEIREQVKLIKRALKSAEESIGARDWGAVHNWAKLASSQAIVIMKAEEEVAQ
jgi:hypothetical protein